MIGMLWFDNDPKTELTIKIERAVAYYHNKYGRPPTVCFVHPSMLAATTNQKEENLTLRAAGVEIRSTRTVLPNHFWIGVNGVNPA
jgi:hypothetical protein